MSRSVYVQFAKFCRDLEYYVIISNFGTLGTIHLRRQHVLGGRGVPMGQWSKGQSTYLRTKNPLHKHFAGMPMVKNRENLPTYEMKMISLKNNRD